MKKYPKAFISYSHDSKEYADKVLVLSNNLRSEGIDTILDQYEESPSEGWPRWMDREIKNSDFVIMICNENYYKRVMGEEEVGKGLGVRWEGKLIYQHLYNAGSLNNRFIPVLFQDAVFDHIPNPLQGSTFYWVDTAEGYENLYWRLRGVNKAQKPELGKLRPLPEKERKSLLSNFVNVLALPEEIEDERKSEFTFPQECIIWKYQIGFFDMMNENYFNLSLDGNILYAGLNGEAVGIDLVSGSCVWKSKVNTYASAPRRYDNSVIVPAYEWVYCWDSIESEKYYHFHNTKWKIHHHCEYGLFATDDTDKGLGYIITNRQAPLPGESPNVLYSLRGIKCMDLRNGMQLWEFNTNETGVSFPILKNNLVYLSTDRTVYALSEYMGHLEWMASINQSPSGNFAPLVVNDRFLAVGSWDPINPEFYEINCYHCLTGEKITSFEIKAEPKQSFKILDMLIDGVLYAAVTDGRIFAWEITTGKCLWLSKKNYPNPLITIRSNELIVCFFGGIVRLSRNDGVEISHLRGKRPERISKAVIQEERVYVACSDGFIYCLSI